MVFKPCMIKIQWNYREVIATEMEWATLWKGKQRETERLSDKNDYKFLNKKSIFVKGITSLVNL